MPGEVRVRFAPSPTGLPHIGNIRTALFNWLFARHQGGKFIVRVEDTDQARLVPGSIDAMLEGLRWLKIDWDEGPEVGGPHEPYFQSQRKEKYQAAVEGLLAAGAAYRDFATTEEIQAEREQAQQAGAPFTYSRQWMAETDADVARFQAEGRHTGRRRSFLSPADRVFNPLVTSICILPSARFSVLHFPGFAIQFAARIPCDWGAGSFLGC